MRLLASDIAKATGGTLEGKDVQVDGVSCDSRTLRSGQLFAAIKAARDGHGFIPAAIGNGAPAYLSSGPKVRGATGILVPDTTRALADVAKLVRSRLPDRLVGVTGSVGKTSTKDMLGPILARVGPVTMSPHSYNNEIGAPLTLANAAGDTATTVLEMGARFLGNIAAICEYARPTVGIVTNVGLAHIGPFGGVENIALTKGELIEALPDHGVAVLNISDELVLPMRNRTNAHILSFGINAGDVRATNVSIDNTLRPSFRLTTPHGSVAIHMHVHGQHQVMNALAAAGAATALGVGLSDIAVGLEAAKLSQWRMELLKASTGATLLNDSYNANPTSVTAALHGLARLPVLGQRIAVLGEMAELGDISNEQHQLIGELAQTLDIELLSYRCPQYGAKDFSSLDEVWELLRETGRSDAILVKGSRVVGLEALVDLLVHD